MRFFVFLLALLALGALQGMFWGVLLGNWGIPFSMICGGLIGWYGYKWIDQTGWLEYRERDDIR